MSFGYSSSVRFETTRADDGRPKIFWEEAREVRPKKKFSYKNREQKYPLRSKRDIVDQKRTEPKQDVKDQAKPDAIATRNAPKTKQASASRQPQDQTKAQVVESEPVLSLTEGQLAKMIENIGKVSKDHPLRISIGKETHQIMLEEDDKENQLEDGVEKKKSRKKKKGSGKLNKETSSISAKADGETKANKPEVEPGYDQEGMKDGNVVDTAAEPESDSPKPDAESTPFTDAKSTARYLSLSERKRLQWEAEKAEEAKIYSPWGKPGSGAPITTSGGDVLADYNTRKPQVVKEQILLIAPFSETQPTGASKSAGNSPSKGEYSDDQTWGITTDDMTSVPDLPHAMRSSFAVGALAPDETRYLPKREIERKKWLQELEQQVAEKKNRNMSNSPMKDVVSPRAYVVQDASEGPNGGDTSWTALGPIAPLDVQNKVLIPSFVRGANTMLDPITLKEMEEKRRRQVEHQKAIQAQVEEKQRLKREAEQKKMEDDLKEERRLQAERDRLSSQYLQEQIKQKRKQDEQTIRVQKLKEMMDEAEYAAKQEKHMKRLQHLQEHGHDTRLYHKTFEAAHTTPRLPSTQPLAATTTLYPAFDAITVEPANVPGLDLTARSHGGYYDNRLQETHGHHGNQSGRYGNDGYLENRTLTPSKDRHYTALSEPDLYSVRKEFGTQTLDGEDAADAKKPRETSAGIEFDKTKLLDIKRSEKVKKVRVLSAKSVPSKGRNPPPPPPQPPQPTTAVTQPKNKRAKSQQLWNYQNQEQKRPLKQSEKDPNYLRRRQESLQRRQQRSQELQAMVIANQELIPDRDRSRSRSRSVSPRQRTRTKSKSPEPLMSRRSRLDVHEYNQWARADRQVTPEPEVVPERSVMRPRSPPVPAVRHKLHEEPGTGHLDTQGDQRGHYSDYLPTYAPVEDGEFIPFLRSSAFLDPSESQRPLPVSREPTMVEQGRKAYAQNQKPGVYGSRMHHIQDNGLENLLPPNRSEKYINIKKDPITHPNLVKDHPTSRQEMILQQLADIRKNLLIKQREIETSISPSDLHSSRT